ncbi:MAG: hypothetical protein WD114_04825 [Phycisphaerales bacterium]
MANPDDDGTRNTPAGGSGESVIARQLTGELYCIGCHYNLRGLSIRANCPECGMPVRATILGIVDPHAHELAPLLRPRLTAIGLCAWSVGAMAAILMVWVLRGAELLRDAAGIAWTPTLASWLGIAGLGVSMIGAMTLIRPHRAVTRIEAIRSALGVSLYGPLIFVYATIYLGMDSNAPSPVLHPGMDSLDRSILRLLMFVLVAGVIWGLRRPAVGLAVRSIIVRTGRVDRQSLMAVLASLGIAAVGDLLHIIGSFISFGIGGDVVSIVTVVVITLGCVLFTVGMANICIDTFRLYPVLVRPGVGLSDIFETNRQKSRREQ